MDDLLPEAFAVRCGGRPSKRGAGHCANSRRGQLIGGMVLHDGPQIAEIGKPGEGKTLGSHPTLLPQRHQRKKGVHIVTVNDYLARRDAEWMGQIHRFLGLSVGLIQQGMSPAERRKNYGCDITYGTNSEFGFDYLRDNMATAMADVVQASPSILLHHRPRLTPFWWMRPGRR